MRPFLSVGKKGFRSRGSKLKEKIWFFRAIQTTADFLGWCFSSLTIVIPAISFYSPGKRQRGVLRKIFIEGIFF